jgi:hypothetical protein
MLESISGFLRKISGQAEKTDRKEKLHVEGIRIAFSAPNPKHPPTEETLTKDKETFAEANFQWSKLQVLFTVEPNMEKYYIYSTPLNPEGTSKSPDIIFDSDSKWGGNNTIPSNDYTTGDVIRAFPKLLKGPNLKDTEKYGQTTYVNTDKSDKAHVYSSQEFKKLFNSDFYIVLNPHTKELHNPFGKVIGIKHPKE